MAIRCERCNAANPTLNRYCQNCAAPLASDLHSVTSLDASGTATGSKIVLFFCVVYLLNITFGFDLLPDNLPIVGNFDEAGVTLLAFKSWMNIQNSKAARAKTIPSGPAPLPPQAP